MPLHVHPIKVSFCFSLTLVTRQSWYLTVPVALVGQALNVRILAAPAPRGSEGVAGSRAAWALQPYEASLLAQTQV